ncbi:MAG: DUF4282 domain-containing protein [Microcella sp.]|nr:DUF4282 domain-containing protein [Microcella sp.]
MTDSPARASSSRKPKAATAAPKTAPAAADPAPAAAPAPDHTLSLDVSAVPGFFKALVDFRFTTFITRRIAGFIYAILLISIVLAGLVAFFSIVVTGVGLMTGPVNAQPISGILTILGALVLVPIATLVAIVLARMIVEVNVALVAIAENTASLRK